MSGAGRGRRVGGRRGGGKSRRRGRGAQETAKVGFESNNGFGGSQRQGRRQAPHRKEQARRAQQVDGHAIADAASLYFGVAPIYEEPQRNLRKKKKKAREKRKKKKNK